MFLPSSSFTFFINNLTHPLPLTAKPSPTWSSSRSIFFSARGSSLASPRMTPPFTSKKLLFILDTIALTSCYHPSPTSRLPIPSHIHSQHRRMAPKARSLHMGVVATNLHALSRPRYAVLFTYDNTNLPSPPLSHHIITPPNE
jgi:hypothetical protein